MGKRPNKQKIPKIGRPLFKIQQAMKVTEPHIKKQSKTTTCQKNPRRLPHTICQNIPKKSSHGHHRIWQNWY